MCTIDIVPLALTWFRWFRCLWPTLRRLPTPNTGPRLGRRGGESWSFWSRQFYQPSDLSIDKKFARCGITRPNRSNFPISLSFLSPSSPPLLSFVFTLISKLFCFLILVFDGPWSSIIMIINGSHHRIYDVSAQLHCSPAVVVIGIILTLVLRTTSKWEKKRLTSMSLVSLAFVNRLISNGSHMLLQSSATSILESPLPLATWFTNVVELTNVLLKNSRRKPLNSARVPSNMVGILSLSVC